MDNDWKKDPRIQSMNPEKIQFLSEFSDQIRRTPKSQLMNRFLSMTLEARQRGITFSDQETDLLAKILIPHMPPADQGRLDLFRTLSRKLAGGGT